MKKSNLCSLSGVLFLIMAFFPMALLGQTNPGRNAEEQHAWRLYKMYQQSKEKVKALELAIKQGNQNIADVSYGFSGGFAIDPNDIASVRRAKELVEIEMGRQKAIEAVWDRHFWGTYEGLAEGYSKSRWDEKEKRNMNLIEWRLINVPINDITINGSWSGPWSNTRGEKGDASLSISEEAGGKVTGIWDGSPILDGKRTGNVVTFRQVVSRRMYSVTFTVSSDGKSGVINYSVTDPDRTPHSFSGTHQLNRK